MFSHLEEVEMSRRYRDDFHLMGCSPEMLVAKDPFLDKHNWDILGTLFIVLFILTGLEVFTFLTLFLGISENSTH